MTFSLLRDILAWLGGSSDAEPRPLQGAAGLALRCLAWTVMLGLIYAFSGQTDKFMYIDF